MSAAPSGTPLWQKIGIKEGHRVLPVGLPKYVAKMLKGVPDHDHVEDNADIVWLFIKTKADLEAQLPTALRAMNPAGMIWVSWPKQGSELSEGLGEAEIREFALAADLVDVKVCTIDDDWSGLKFVVRKE